MKYTRKMMREMMEIRGYSKHTIQLYIDHIRYLAKFFNKAPHLLTPEHIHQYQVYMVKEKKASYAFFNQSVCAMRFFLML